MRPVSNDPFELLHNNWRPTLSVTGADGLPLSGAAATCCARRHAQLSFRLPRRCRRRPRPPRSSARWSATRPTARMFVQGRVRNGWLECTDVRALLEQSMQAASQAFFRPRRDVHGHRRQHSLHGHARRAFPGTQFLVTGVLGPQSNAHGPNEFLHLECGRRLTGCVSRVLADHAARGR